MQLLAQKGERNIPAHAGKRVEADDMLYAIRNIPAHAGKTCVFVCAGEGLKEHPRARGENRRSTPHGHMPIGTSPRTRGKPHTSHCVKRHIRNIPAHAGKTVTVMTCTFLRWEHPRARGENEQGIKIGRFPRGTSPRTRGKLGFLTRHKSALRNIPAHAGKTSWAWEIASVTPEHPRARGENTRPVVFFGGGNGTSPRTRGKHLQKRHIPCHSGNIPAHAGKTE